MTDAKTWTLHFDGGSLGNPGPSAGAAVLVASDGEAHAASEFIPRATNNQAEYRGLLVGLRLARSLGIDTLLVHGDSLLVVNQVNGTWRAKDEALQERLAEARALVEEFDAITLAWVPREENADADREVRRCLDVHLPKPKPTPRPAKASAATTEGGSGDARDPDGRFAKVNAKPAGEASFKELAALKVGGSDGFSRKAREPLLALLGAEADDAVAAIDDALTRGKPNLDAKLVAQSRDKLALTALRWTARGLRAEHAAQKVLVDLELSLAATRGRRRS